MISQHILLNLRIINDAFFLHTKPCDASKMRGWNINFTQHILLISKKVFRYWLNFYAIFRNTFRSLNQINFRIFLFDHRIWVFNLNFYEVIGPINILGWTLTQLGVSFKNLRIFPIIWSWEKFFNFRYFMLFLID